MQYLVALCAISTATAFVSQTAKTGLSSLNGVKSKSVPFMDQPPALDGTSAGDVGFDPLGLSSMFGDKDWSKQVVPDFWVGSEALTPISTFEWMKEAEIKHCRIAMLAFLGYVSVDAGLRLPGSMFYGGSSFTAHDMAVSNGSMGFLLFIVSILELSNGAAIYDQAKGSGRKAGEFGFDPLNLSKGNMAKYATNEIINGRTAMLAISGILTQQALFPDKLFPYV